MTKLKLQCKKCKTPGVLKKFSTFEYWYCETCKDELKPGDTEVDSPFKLSDYSKNGVPLSDDDDEALFDAMIKNQNAFGGAYDSDEEDPIDDQEVPVSNRSWQDIVDDGTFCSGTAEDFNGIDAIISRTVPSSAESYLLDVGTVHKWKKMYTPPQFGGHNVPPQESPSDILRYIGVYGELPKPKHGEKVEGSFDEISGVFVPHGVVKFDTSDCLACDLEGSTLQSNPWALDTDGMINTIRSRILTTIVNHNRKDAMDMIQFFRIAIATLEENFKGEKK